MLTVLYGVLCPQIQLFRFSKWVIKLNPTKSHSIIISRTRTPLPLHTPLTLCGLDLEEFYKFLKLLGGIFDKKLPFENYIYNIESSIAKKQVLFANFIKKNLAIIVQFFALLFLTSMLMRGISGYGDDVNESHS